MDPWLPEGVDYELRVRTLSGFAGLSRAGYYGRGKQVKAGTVSTALTAVGQAISVATGRNPTKVEGSDKFLPRLAETLEGWGKEDPATKKKLPVEADVPEFVAGAGRLSCATELLKAVGDLMLIAFYFMLRIGEYTMKKGQRASSKQTQQFKMSNCTFFKENKLGQLRQLPWDAPDADIMTASSMSLKLGNQKNGYKDVCVHHEANGSAYNCPVKAGGRRYCHIRANTSDRETYLSAFFVNGVRYDVLDQDIRDNIKWAATELDYHARRGIPVERVDTHSLRGGGANALSLAGYSDTQIQKMGRWRGATFKEYIHGELTCFSKGMSTAMKKSFGFVNIAGGVPLDVTSAVMVMEQDLGAAAA